jgi:hypothetical protein
LEPVHKDLVLLALKSSSNQSSSKDIRESFGSGRLMCGRSLSVVFMGADALIGTGVVGSTGEETTIGAVEGVLMKM